MMRRLALVLLAGLAVGVPALPARAETAEWLREVCSDGDLYYAYGSCAGYLMALIDVDGEGAAFCPPPETTIFTLNLDIEDALGELDAIDAEAAPEFGRRLLAAVYPCASEAE